MNNGTQQTVAVRGGMAAYTKADEVLALVDDALRSLSLPPDFIRPGERVVLKPNWVKEHDECKPGPDQWEHVVTHPSVIEGVIRWVAPQLNRGASRKQIPISSMQ